MREDIDNRDANAINASTNPLTNKAKSLAIFDLYDDRTNTVNNTAAYSLNRLLAYINTTSDRRAP
jgi:hypothetical protein